jgi:L-threonylcarbamoyladenylate synthase
MKTVYFHQNELAAAGDLLANGGLVVFPTETVYGLGADARNESAIRALFEAKGRPSDNPLIVHVANVELIDSFVLDISENNKRLMEHFWPGPITLVFPKSNVVSNLVTAGLDTVAVRIPSHPWAIEILKHANIPVAAPSANRSGSPSATTWQAAQQDLDQRVDAIVCGPPTDIGLESTVVDATGKSPRILRPGKITFEEIAEICPSVIPYLAHTHAAATHLNSPGLRHRHYQPRANVVLVDNHVSLTNHDAWFIGINEHPEAHLCSKSLRCLSVEEYSSKLFDFFRQADNAGVTTIYCEAVHNSGIGVALMDRLQRAGQS